MKILSIETSCDETAISVMDFESAEKDRVRVKILANIVRSQVELHKEFGGVYPNLAKREHAKNLPPIFIQALKDAGIYSKILKNFRIDAGLKETVIKMLSREGEMADEIIKIAESVKKPDIDHIVVTAGPGLEPALWVGINFAKALGLVWNIPVVAANHMEGHFLSTLIDAEVGKTQEINLSEITFPVLALLISGGHTELVLAEDWLRYKKIGQTKDDAVGEAFDKVARLLGLPYPGGPQISTLAENARKGAEQTPTNAEISLPRPMINSGDYDFSFSGIKTAVLYLVKKLGDLDEQTKKDIAREFEEAVTEVLVSKTRRAILESDVKTLIIGGGVSANEYIRDEMRKMIKKDFPDVKILLPDKHLSTDNSVMIGLAGYFNITFGEGGAPMEGIKANSHLSL